MTTDADDKAGRRPPTIELAATEVSSPAEQAAAADTDTGGTAEQQSASSETPASSPSSRFTSYIVSVLGGAALMAGLAAALWFAGVIPSREAAPVASATSSSMPSPSTPSPAAPAVNSPPSPAAQNNPATADLAARLDRVERSVEAQRSDPALGNRIAELAAQTKSLSDNLAALTRRVDETAATSQSAGKQADMALNAAQAAKGASEAAGKDQLRRDDIEPLAARIMALESAVKGLAAATAPLAAAGANDRAARLTVAAQALRAAVESGAPYQSELNAVRSLGVDQNATTALEPFAASGVPSAAALARELAALVPALQDAAEPRSGDATFLDRLKSNAQKLVRVTPLNAPAGNDPQTVVDRIRLDAARADTAAALADLNALPDAVKPLAAAWSKKAGARDAAVAASRKIAADALADLAQPSAR
ncbi:MAG: COG4223 family protein [Xanthobacteraceae bacterium]